MGALHFGFVCQKLFHAAHKAPVLVLMFPADSCVMGNHRPFKSLPYVVWKCIMY